MNDDIKEFASKCGVTLEEVAKYKSSGWKTANWLQKFEKIELAPNVKRELKDKILAIAKLKARASVQAQHDGIRPEAVNLNPRVRNYTNNANELISGCHKRHRPITENMRGIRL